MWTEEVERLRPGSAMRSAADAARRTLERGREPVHWLPCEPEEVDGTMLAGCVKVYVPLGREPSAAPYGFVFEFVATNAPEPAFALELLAYGERHPAIGTRSVYERAHKRLHGSYPDQ